MIDTAEYLAALTDRELLDALDVAKEDLQDAADTQQNSEWHGSCFAGVIVMAAEAQKRGISRVTKH